MATITVEKRTRALITDTWSVWTATTDAPPYTNTNILEYRIIDDSYVTVEDLTANVEVDDKYVVTGTGVFDDVMETINKHIVAQYTAGRLKAEGMAQLYVGVIPSALSESIKFLLQRKTSSQQLRVLEAQEALYIRQKEAFDDNKYQKVLEAQLNYNGMIFQDAEAPDVLNVALEQKVNDIFNKLTLNQSITAMPEV